MYKQYLEEIRSRIKHDLSQGVIKHDRFRMIMLHDSAMQSLREEIIHSLGYKSARGLYKRMGFASGCSDAEIALRERANLTDMELFSLGPQLHSIEGLVVVEPLEMDIDISNRHISGTFLWKHSYEAETSLKANGISDEPTCWMQLGYAMGFCSTLVDEFIYVKEVSCQGAGDSLCKIIAKPLDQWKKGEVDLSDFETYCVSDHINWLQDRIDDLKHGNNSFSFNEIIGHSPAIKETIELVDKVSPTNATIMILGETGVGKELVAKRIHEKSNRSDGPFICLNCSAIPEGLIETELFGCEKGAYTGATKSRVGKFERANGGTIFLDEIAELSSDSQAKLLRVLQEGEVERVGGSNPIAIDVRVIAATHKNLEQQMRDNCFRDDLYYRLMTIPIIVPPLRARQSDLELLAELFIKHYRVVYHKPNTKLDLSALQALKEHQWPGNIRELKNIIERLVILSNNDVILEHDVRNELPSLHSLEVSQRLDIEKCVSHISNEKVSIDVLTNKIISHTLKRNNNNISQSAKDLGMTRAQLDYRVLKHKIKPIE